MALFKQLKELINELSEIEAYVPVNGIGKWAKQVRIDSLKSKIERIKKELKRRKGVGGNGS